MFETPVVYKHLWKKEYSAEEYYGFVLTGNRFVQLPADIKEKAYSEIVQHAEKFDGRIVRPYLCVLYLASKISMKKINHLSGII